LNKHARSLLTLAMLNGDWAAYLACFGKQERLILLALGCDRLTLAQIIAKTALPSRSVSTLLSKLGNYGVLVQESWGIWVIAVEDFAKYLRSLNNGRN
jgi:DNA-binding IclR family transcriptional regulator